ncbi:hypothetical protein [Xanthobacter autotrophicus]|uniref:hypothetical protein n=1 Tax=Xanthobacter autotrophicus TaxID=280 RepID=UPI0024A64741|nr:hypothetical protein [Xanthobacter autotrophicus]MDI4655574.1 hypothetical protein [Xanthobacter autotrophicus]
MKAIVLTERGAHGVALRDMPEPAVPEGWAKVRMLAASVNRVDLYMRDSGVGVVAEVPAAFAHLEDAARMGKILIRIP